MKKEMSWENSFQKKIRKGEWNNWLTMSFTRCEWTVIGPTACKVINCFAGNLLVMENMMKVSWDRKKRNPDLTSECKGASRFSTIGIRIVDRWQSFGNLLIWEMIHEIFTNTLFWITVWLSRRKVCRNTPPFWGYPENPSSRAFSTLDVGLKKSHTCSKPMFVQLFQSKLQRADRRRSCPFKVLSQTSTSAVQNEGNLDPTRLQHLAEDFVAPFPTLDLLVRKSVSHNEWR
jgi:hypothetical protein